MGNSQTCPLHGHGLSNAATDPVATRYADHAEALLRRFHHAEGVSGQVTPSAAYLQNLVDAFSLRMTQAEQVLSEASAPRSTRRRVDQDLDQTHTRFFDAMAQILDILQYDVDGM